jgi:hypothetical protein
MAQVTLKITWKNYDGREISRQLTTYYAENGLYDYISSI